MPKSLFVVELTYHASLEEVDQHVPAHIDFLKRSYEKGIFLASGAKSPRTGGVILAHDTSKTELSEWMEQDPFHLHNIATYNILEFSASRYAPELSVLLAGS